MPIRRFWPNKLASRLRACGRHYWSPRRRNADLPLDKADAAIPARGGSNADLRVTVVRIAPASALEEAVHARDVTEGYPTGQIAARIDHAAPTLAHVQSFAAWVLARGRATSRPNAIHEEHARAMIVFQIVDVGLEARGICNTNTSTGAGFVRNDNTRRVAVGVERVRLL